IRGFHVTGVQTCALPILPQGFERFAAEYSNTPEDYARAGVELSNPLEVNEENLAQGQHLYLVNCAVCHGAEGTGDGAITKDRSEIGRASCRERARKREVR